jgi:class 3 adenylate cyclase
VASQSAPVRFLQPRTRAPTHLAEKILTSRGALEGERKQVTVLFADVKGSMDLAAQVGSREKVRGCVPYDCAFGFCRTWIP